MPYRKIKFENSHYYHIFNRSIGESLVFDKPRDYIRFIKLIDFLRLNPTIRYSYVRRLYPQNEQQYFDQLRKNGNPIVGISAYCLMPNHFHLLVKQFSDKGLQRFMKSLQGGYAMYYNKKKRT